MWVTSKPCMECGETSKIEMSEAQYAELSSPNRRRIDQIFDDRRPPEVELIITGTHPECWKKIFADDKDWR